MATFASWPGRPHTRIPEATAETAILALVAQVYESAPRKSAAAWSRRCCALGVLSLVAIANGIFAKIRFRNAGQDPACASTIFRTSAPPTWWRWSTTRSRSARTVDGLVQ